MTYPPLRLSDSMPFGKHEGEEIEDLIYDDPGYMSWLFSEEVVVLDVEVIKQMEERKII